MQKIKEGLETTVDEFFKNFNIKEIPKRIEDNLNRIRSEVSTNYLLLPLGDKGVKDARKKLGDCINLAEGVIKRSIRLGSDSGYTPYIESAEKIVETLLNNYFEEVYDAPKGFLEKVRRGARRVFKREGPVEEELGEAIALIGNLKTGYEKVLKQKNSEEEIKVLTNKVEYLTEVSNALEGLKKEVAKIGKEVGKYSKEEIKDKLKIYEVHTGRFRDFAKKIIEYVGTIYSKEK